MSSPSRFRIVILISGGGGLMRRAVHAAAVEHAPFCVTRVIASRADAAGLDVARSAGVETAVVRGNAPVSQQHEIWREIEAGEPQGVMLLGWLHRLHVPPPWMHRVVNVHPSLLPLFGGKGMWGHHVHEAVLAAGVRVSGCTYHFVDEHYDTGPIVAQYAVPVEDADTVDTLADRVIGMQHLSLVPFLEAWSSGRIRLEGGRWVGAPAAAGLRMHAGL